MASIGRAALLGVFAFPAVSSETCSTTGTCADPDEFALMQAMNQNVRRSIQPHEAAPALTYPIPDGWSLHRENWDCGGHAIDVRRDNTVTTNQACADVCSAEGHEIAAFWHHDRNICRCYDTCDEGEPEPMPQWPNHVMQRIHRIPVGWSLHSENWDCGGHAIDVRGNSTVTTNQACADVCGAEGHAIATFWHHNRNICRCYDTCDEGEPSSMPQWPNHVMQRDQE